jgi:hypothetical protein
MIKKNSWVQITKEILSPHERLNHLPEPTKQVPFVMWVKGYLCDEAEIGSFVEIKTITGRMESGVLVCENPSYMHTYGEFVPELLEIDLMVKTSLFGGDDSE